MKGLSLYLSFCWLEFVKGKTFKAVSCGPWVDFDTKVNMGTKVEVVIVEDNTEYPTKGGKVISNLYERMQIKVPKEISIPVGSIVEPVGVEAKVYGDYHNKLSVKDDDVRVVSQAPNGGKQ